MTVLPTGIAAPDAQAISQVIAVQPVLTALERAGSFLGLQRHELLHAGPPLGEARPCVPVLNAAVAAILYEGWARTPAEAKVLLQDRTVRFRPAQDVGCVLPLADVLSPSMWVQVVRDASCVSRWACSPLHGGATEAMRVGVFDPAVLSRLQWLDEQFAPGYRSALVEPVALADLADQGLALGDDCHGNTAAASRAFAGLMNARLDAAVSGPCLAFLAGSPGFFLNLWMAASKCMLLAAEGTPGSSVVTAAGGNGLAFGVQIANEPGRWWTVPARPPVIVGAPAELAQASLGAIGDSAIVDVLGFGAMTALEASGMARAAPGYAALWPGQAPSPGTMSSTGHPAFHRSGARMVMRASQVRDASSSPVISLGVLDKDGLHGRLGGGYYAVPPALFTEMGLT